MKNDGRGIAQLLDENPVENTTLTSTDLNEWLKQIFSLNNGSKKRIFGFYGTQKEFNDFINKFSV